MNGMMNINADRLLADLHALRQFGADGNGVVRLALSAADMAARRWLVERMKAAGLEAVIDGVGTVFGRSRKPGPAVLIGSHSDTQPSGGWLDGAYGVICGLEIARALSENPATADYAVDVAAWSDEEGTFAGYLGSRSFVGEEVARLIATARNADGAALVEALAQAGLGHVPRVLLERGRHMAYLEPHIEQGGRLETAGKSIGIVTGIVGICEYRVTFVGARNHAGTTPMPIRRDASAALIAFVPELNEVFRGLADADTVWTIGRIDLSPGSLSVIPGEASLYLQFRDGDPARLAAMAAALRQLAGAFEQKGKVAVQVVEHDLPSTPVAMDSSLQRHLIGAANALAPGDWQTMPSGAGHDAQILAPHLPTAMLFVPSIGGVSHDFSEDTRAEHLALGCAVAAEAVARIHHAAQGKPIRA
jgi:N-carbamoyl-L-amino-acid hydrolase